MWPGGLTPLWSEAAEVAVRERRTSVLWSGQVAPGGLTIPEVSLISEYAGNGRSEDQQQHPKEVD